MRSHARIIHPSEYPYKITCNYEEGLVETRHCSEVFRGRIKYNARMWHG